MSQRFIRVYEKKDYSEIQRHVLLYGALSGSCGQCQALDVKLDAVSCPSCGTEYKYIAFQNVKDHLPKMHKISSQRPQIVFVDYDDFKRAQAEAKARGILE